MLHVLNFNRTILALRFAHSMLTVYFMSIHRKIKKIMSNLMIDNFHLTITVNEKAPKASYKVASKK